MAYINHYNGWEELETLFIKHGYKIYFGLDNSPSFEKCGELIDYDNLPEDLQTAFDNFAQLHNLN